MQECLVPGAFPPGEGRWERILVCKQSKSKTFLPLQTMNRFSELTLLFVAPGKPDKSFLPGTCSNQCQPQPC